MESKPIRILPGQELIMKQEFGDQLQCGDRVTFVKVCLGCLGAVVKEVKDHIPLALLHMPGAEAARQQAVNEGAVIQNPSEYGTIEVEKVLHSLRRFATLPMINSQNGVMQLDVIQHEFRSMLEQLGLTEQYRNFMSKPWNG